MNEELVHVKEYYKDENGNDTDSVRFEYTTLNIEKHGEQKEYRRDGSLETISSFKNGEKHGEEKDYFDGKLFYRRFYKNGELHGVSTAINKYTGKEQPAVLWINNNYYDLIYLYQPIFDAIEKLEATRTVATHLMLEIALNPNKDTVSINVVEEVK